jgi:hypothetical protein
MKNLNKNITIASLLTSGILLSSTAFATLGTVTDTGVTSANIQENDEVTLGFSHPQSLAVSQPNNEVNRGSNGVINRTWHVVTNNAVTVKFTGQSPDADGTVVASSGPTFYKAEVDADNSIITDKFDHLVTTFSASVDVSGTTTAHAGSQSGDTHWGGGASPSTTGSVDTASEATSTIAQTTTNTSVVSGTSASLVDTTSATGLNQTFGSIMPNDDGNFSLTLSAKGVGDVATTQSGDYQITVVTSFMAAEKGNYTVVASTAETANDGTTETGFLTDTQTYDALGADQADNSEFSFVSSTSTLGTEQSPDVISDALTTDGTVATNTTIY